MNIIYEYSHLGGIEIMKVRYPELWEEIRAAVQQVEPGKPKVSKEKTMKGRLLDSPKDMNSQFKAIFSDLGYAELRDTFSIKLDNSDYQINGCYKQVDFTKDKVLIEVQFGKYPFMFYDLAKFQYFFNENKADVGIEIVPCHLLHKMMSTGVSYGEQLINDIERLKRHFPAVPVAVLLINQ
jgi:hypothetical protein